MPARRRTLATRRYLHFFWRLGFFFMDAIAEMRVRRLADAISALPKPLAPILEYADDLAKHANEGDDIGVLCIAALLRAKARAVKDEIDSCLHAVENAADSVARTSK